MESEKTGVIYTLVCVDGRGCYVGLTTNYKKRERQHLSRLRSGNHENKHLQRAYNLYGESSFFFQLMEIDIPISELAEREKLWAKWLFPKYNIATPGEAPMLGRSLSPEHRAKISESLKGHKINVGRRHTEQALENMRKAQKGHPCSDEQRQKLILAWKNRSHVVSDETREKIRKAHQGRKCTPESRARMSKAQRDKITNYPKKAIKQIDHNTNQVIKIWVGAVQASKELGIAPQSIYEVATKKKHHITAGGYKWEYV